MTRVFTRHECFTVDKSSWHDSLIISTGVHESSVFLSNRISHRRENEIILPLHQLDGCFASFAWFSLPVAVKNKLQRTLFLSDSIAYVMHVYSNFTSVVTFFLTFYSRYMHCVMSIHSEMSSLTALMFSCRRKSVIACYTVVFISLLNPSIKAYIVCVIEFIMHFIS